MKKLLVVILSLVSVYTYGQMAKSEKEVLEVLSTISSDKSVVVKDIIHEVDRAYKVLDRVVDYVHKNPNDKMISEAIRVGIYAASLDPSHQSGEILLDIYTKHTNQFEKLLDKFPPKKAKLLKTHIEAAKSENEQGNG